MALPALPTHLTLELVTPDHAVAHEQVDEIQLPGVKGYFGVLQDTRRCWRCSARDSSGIAAVRTRPSSRFTRGWQSAADRVTVLCRSAERADEIDVARAEAAKQRAEAELKKPQMKPEDFERVAHCADEVAHPSASRVENPDAWVRVATAARRPAALAPRERQRMRIGWGAASHTGARAR